jgi:hypothetical protein
MPWWHRHERGERLIGRGRRSERRCGANAVREADTDRAAGEHEGEACRERGELKLRMKVSAALNLGAAR